MAHRYTEPLLAADDGLPVYSDGYRLVRLVETYVKHEGKALVLDEWQKHLLIRVLERCPPGHPREGRLRFSEVTISIPRQAGKSMLASVLALYGLLMHSSHPKVLGVAPTAKLAEHVYKYTKGYVNTSKVLSKTLRTTNTRGIYKRDETGSYLVLAGDADKLQGYPASLSIVDELHLVKEDIYAALVAGQFAQTDPLLVGISTAGDANSTLLHSLYKKENEGIESYGFFVYEASDDSELTLEAIVDANPAVACGRISAQSIYDKKKTSKESDWKRFVLNRFVDGSAEPWVPTADWLASKGQGIAERTDLVWSVDVTPGLGFASIAVARKVGNVIEAELVASFVAPTQDQLYKQVVAIRKKHGRALWVMYGYTLDDLAKRLRERGMDVLTIRGANNARAAGAMYSTIVGGRLSYRPVGEMREDLVTVQSGNAKTANRDGGFILDSRNGKEIDALMALTYAAYAADIGKEKGFIVA